MTLTPFSSFGNENNLPCNQRSVGADVFLSSFNRETWEQLKRAHEEVVASKSRQPEVSLPLDLIYSGANDRQRRMASSEESRAVLTLAETYLAEQEKIGRHMETESHPKKASEFIGHVKVADRTRCVYLIHAVTVVITDGENVVVVGRKEDPGAGKKAFPGGFMKNGEASPITASREGFEETASLLPVSEHNRLGLRKNLRPEDIRVARGNGLVREYNVWDGDLFMVTDQPVVCYVPDLTKMHLVPGSDASDVFILPIDHVLKQEKEFAVLTHYDLIKGLKAWGKEIRSFEPPRPKTRQNSGITEQRLMVNTH